MSVVMPTLAVSDEGMWLFNNFPKERFSAAYNYTPDDAWLDNVRLSSVRLSSGCSSSFVSPNGLVMTNDHCARECVQQLSAPGKDLVATGYYAASLADEQRCPAMEADQLVEITDVTEQVLTATKGLTGAPFTVAQRAVASSLEKACTSDDKTRCDVVTLYHGGRYNLYRYRRFQDVRLVMAPELQIAFFGGDPDNFNFPRYNLDVSFLRVYENGAPAKLDHYLRWSALGAQDGEVSFVSGNPGKTDRQLTTAELAYERDVVVPDRFLDLARMRGQLEEFAREGAEAKRTGTVQLLSVENSYKVFQGRMEMLHDPLFFAKLATSETALRAKVNKSAANKKKFGGAWDAIAAALVVDKEMHHPMHYIEEGGWAASSSLGRIVRLLVRGTAERQKANDERLPDYRDSALPQLEQRIFSKAPIFGDVEELNLRYGLTRMRERLGADDPFVVQLLGKESPAQVAARLVKGTTLKDPAVRKTLWAGGPAAIAASTDPLVVFYRNFDPQARALRKLYEDQVESVLKKNDELFAQARFAVEGTSTYPDATFTLRLSYGKVAGYEQNGKQVPSMTDFAGMYARVTGQAPFDLPLRWVAAKSKLKLATPFNLVTTNDIIGGNSGSPLINRAGEVIGLIFDGNIQSLGGDYGYDGRQNRAVAVTSQALIESLGTVYNARRLLDELLPKGTTSAGRSRRLGKRKSLTKSKLALFAVVRTLVSCPHKPKPPPL